MRRGQGRQAVRGGQPNLKREGEGEREKERGEEGSLVKRHGTCSSSDVKQDNNMSSRVSRTWNRVLLGVCFHSFQKD
jgi:hypothetical protein